MKIALFGSKYQEKSQIEHIFNAFCGNNVKVWVQREFYYYLKETFSLNHKIEGIISSRNFDVDLILTIGGDGTFLQTVACVDPTDTPIMGINAGRLGFLADVTKDELDDVLVDILHGKYQVEKRSMLKLVSEDGIYSPYNLALNEIAVTKQDTASMLTIHAYIDDEFLTTYESDGLIISTPTGSTAYSLSVGGPILSPSTASFILAAIAPHSLSARPLVIDDNSLITLVVESRSENFLVSLDGRSKVLESGATLHIQKSSFQLNVAKPQNHTFYTTLRNKLKWGVDPRQSKE